MGEMLSAVPETIWRVAPKALSLGNEDVHFWRIFPDQAADRIRYWESFLSADERHRANRFPQRRRRTRVPQLALVVDGPQELAYRS